MLRAQSVGLRDLKMHSCDLRPRQASRVQLEPLLAEGH